MTKLSAHMALVWPRSEPARPSPLPPRSGGEGSGVGGSAAIADAAFPADSPPTPDPSPPRAMRVEGGERTVFAGATRGEYIASS
ncbi:MAG: hypothetical protein E8A46_04325 [Bradyrhizobium sp.]|nr:MAG: hypothetical protein E8A46_04325 [Bradyrhizobium sp.]